MVNSTESESASNYYTFPALPRSASSVSVQTNHAMEQSAHEHYAEDHFTITAPSKGDVYTGVAGGFIGGTTTLVTGNPRYFVTGTLAGGSGAIALKKSAENILVTAKKWWSKGRPIPDNSHNA